MSGIYIHIPFCKQACHYCNFHFSTSLKLKDALVAALVNEIRLTPFFPITEHKDVVQTIYFGGGTPGILPTDDLKKIFEAIDTKFNIAEHAEITLEANPDDINDANLYSWQSLGVNRLSVGIQSFQDEELSWMNRIHSAKDSLLCIDKIIHAGFNNFSIDLIYGSPLLNNDNWKRNVAIAIEKNIPHISCYALTVEPKTALAKMIEQKKKMDIDTDKQAHQFLLLMDWMAAAGYEHYEISNFSLTGMRSRHNSSYWQGEPYYGFGPSAHSFYNNMRSWNITNNALYIQSLEKNLLPSESEILTPTQQLNEYIMTSLRTIEGIDIQKIRLIYGEEFVQKILYQCDKYVNNEKLKIKNEKIILTNEGKLLADGIAVDLFF